MTTLRTSARCAIVGAYVGVWITFYLLVHERGSSSRHDSHDSSSSNAANSGILVSLVEVIKIIVSSGLYLLQNYGPSSCKDEEKRIVPFPRWSELRSVLLGYIPIAGLYAIYNNLMFLNLKGNNPLVYLILSSSRLLMTAVVWQIKFRVNISSVRKLSLVVITLGIVVKELFGMDETTTVVTAIPGEVTTSTFQYSSAVLILSQMACSVMASVCNEKLLKHDSVNPHLQNICLYVLSVVMNVLLGVIGMERGGEQDSDNLFTALATLLASPRSIAIVLTLATAGIMSSMVLRYENSVTKAVASAVETIFCPIAQFLLVGTTFSVTDMFAVALVSVGTLLYSCPVAGTIRGKYPRKERTVRRPGSYKIKKLPRLLSSFTFLGASTLYFSASTTRLLHLHQQTAEKDTLLQQQELRDRFQQKHDYAQRTSELQVVVVSPPSSSIEDLPACTKKNSLMQSRPANLRRIKYKRIDRAQDVVSYLVSHLQTGEIPVSIMYGTMLHEHRNGTGACLKPRLNDKDMDLAVFARHFDSIIAMDSELRRKFGWRVNVVGEEKLFLQVLPLDDQRKSGMPNEISYQIDVYGFKCHEGSKILHFPWDDVSVAENAFLPLKPHKRVVGRSSYLHMPSNPQCLLENMYGADFMTPKTGHFIRKAAYDNPRCDRVLDVSEQIEYERQIKFCSREERTGPKDRPLAEERLGFLACISSREDAVNAIVLAQSIHQMNRNGSVLNVEFYHHAELSPYVAAKLESHKGVQVINLGTSTIKNTCLVEAMTATELRNIILVDPSIILIRRILDIGEINLHQEKPYNQARIIGDGLGGSITSTSLELDVSIDTLNHSSAHCNFGKAYSFKESLSKGAVAEEIILASIPEEEGIRYSAGPRFSYKMFVEAPVAAFAYPIDNGARAVTPRSHTEESWIADTTAHRTILLDRPLGWVAFDAGIHPQRLNSGQEHCSSFNSIDSATKSIWSVGDGKSIVLNIDLVMTLDEHLIAMHNENAFGSWGSDDVQRQLQNLPVSSLSLSKILATVRNPCLPNNVASEWLGRSIGRNYTSCIGKPCSQPVSLAEEFLDILALNEDVEIIFDLKASNNAGQVRQAQKILQLIQRKNPNVQARLLDRVAIRFFPTDHAPTVLPDHAYENIISGEFPLKLQLYSNAPSKSACLQISAWTERYKLRFAGCFILENHAGIAKSWNDFSKAMNVTDTVPVASHVKFICDVPRKQDNPDPGIWNDGLVKCVESGYDWIHHPLSVSPPVNHSMPSASILSRRGNVASVLSTALAGVSSSLALSKAEQTPQSDLLSRWVDYTSYWGVTSPYRWTPQKQQWKFTGPKKKSYGKLGVLRKNDLVFRCVSKILTVMLFLRLEELGFLRIDDAVQGLQYHVTWKQVFSNTAGEDGSMAGAKFHYSNFLWSHVADAVYSATGVPFLDSVTLHILDPMGLTGGFDTNTSYPPLPARGFVGSHEDMLLIGCTLASGGVSPKTRVQVLSESSVHRMLSDSTREQNVTESFAMDHTVQSMDRFRGSRTNNNGTLFSSGVVDGYGLGLWRVHGWRSTPSLSSAGAGAVPIRGWLAMGSSEAVMYFDTTTLVVGITAAQRVLGLELTAPFAKVVSEM